MSHQITKVDLIPNGELSVCNVSQFDNGRVLPFEILENKEAYNIPNDIRVELHCRKPDGNIVTLPSESISNNIVTFLSTTQLTACYGKNICEIALYGPDDYLIGSCNFILEVEKSPTYGGINSTSAIHNLESQIMDIAEDFIPEILPDYLDNYYTKSEVDALIDNIFPTFTASGAIASFITALTKPLVSVVAAEGATTVTACGVNLFNKAFVLGQRWEGDGSYSTGMGNRNAGCPDKIPCKPSTTYCFVFPNYVKPIYMYLSEFDSSKANIQKSSAISINSTTHIAIFTTGADTRYISFSLYANIEISPTEISEVGVNYPATYTTYRAYNGQTVPVSEATNLVTQSGINNVFADVGDVTVGYKYMPMPETQTNSNRLALSSVRSDIIKEKSEIEEQSDIIEDIERGNKDE